MKKNRLNPHADLSGLSELEKEAVVRFALEDLPKIVPSRCHRCGPIVIETKDEIKRRLAAGTAKIVGDTRALTLEIARLYMGENEE